MRSQLPQFIGNAGAAFRLDEPADAAIEIEHPEGLIVIREGAPYVTVALNEAHDVSSARSVTWRVVQEAFDVFSARTRNALSTSLGEREYILWNREGDVYDLTCVDTIEGQWSVSAQFTTSTVPTTPQVVPFAHHQSLRFYRLSQLTPDLFDAYRNAYLALECLVSEESPKGQRESELNWLKRVISGPFSDAIPSGLQIEATLDAIYRDGRNPLFHAKSNETFYAPHGSERQDVQRLFETLTLLLVAMLRHKLGHAAVGGWGNMSQAVLDDQARISFSFDELLLRHEDRAVSVSPIVEVFDMPRRFGQLWARATTVRQNVLPFMSDIEVQRGGEAWMQINFAESIPLNLVNTLSLELNMLKYHARAPKPSHPK